MNETPGNKSSRRRITRWALVGLAIFVTLIAIFYTGEDWRGKRAWENCKRELEAKGMVLDWEKFIPPPVPDGQNFFKAPKMTTWFVKGHGGTELSTPLTSTNTFAIVSNDTGAKDYLAWSDQFVPDFDQIREALQRPCARMDGDYSRPNEIPIPNFVSLRVLAQVLAQRTKCYLQLGQPENALRELTLLNDSRRITEGAPTGEPMTLVAAMINVAIAGLYGDTIADGLQRNAWREPQLAALQEQLAGIDLAPFIIQSFASEPAANCRTLETADLGKIMTVFSESGDSRSTWQKIKAAAWNKYALVPRGWAYQNMALIARLDQKRMAGFDPTNHLILPGTFKDLTREMSAAFSGNARPYTFLAALMMSNFNKVMQTLARNQTLLNEARVVCSLERYHLAHGEYPETLDALAPQFIEKIPHDIIGGQPLHYRRTGDGKYLLYSVGWNETDDGGQIALKKDGSEDRENGDWVWHYPAK